MRYCFTVILFLGLALYTNGLCGCGGGGGDDNNPALPPPDDINKKGWVRTWGGVGNYDQGVGVATDSSGNVYVTGWFSNTVDFDPGTSTDEHVSNGEWDTFLSKFDSSGDFQWCRTWGGSGRLDDGVDVAVGNSGAIYVTGRFQETVDFDPSAEIDEHTSLGGWDIYLSKFDQNGDFKWVRTWGGESPGDEGFGVATDSFGGIYVVGRFARTVDFNPGIEVDEHISHGIKDIFLCKYDSAGGFIWAVTWGGAHNDRGMGVATDGNGNIYVTGDFEGTVDFDPGEGTIKHTSNGFWDIFLSKFDSSGGFQWARTWGGEDPLDYGVGTAVDSSGAVYVTGSFHDVVDFDPGPGTDEHKSNGSTDNFLSKFDSDGDFQWSRTWGGSDLEYCYGVALDSFDNIYVTGHFELDVDFDPGPGVDVHSSIGLKSVFLSKLHSSGNFLWARTWGAKAISDDGNDLAVDGSGNIYVTGWFNGAVDFDPGPGVDEHESHGGLYRDFDIFLSKFPPDGNW